MQDVILAVRRLRAAPWWPPAPCKAPSSGLNPSDPLTFIAFATFLLATAL